MNEEKNDKNIYILTVLYSYIILFTNVDLNYHLGIIFFQPNELPLVLIVRWISDHFRR